MKNKLINILFVVVILMASFSVYFSVADNVTIEVNGEEEQIIPETPEIDPSMVPGAYTNALDCYLAAYKLKQENKNYKIHITGTVTAGAMGINIAQPFISEIIVDNNHNVYEEDSTKAKSSFTESTATRIFYNKHQDGVLIKKSNKIDDNLNATFGKETNTITKEQYISQYGYLPSESFCDINESTIQKIEKFRFDGERYIIKFILNNTAPTKDYKHKIVIQAGAKSEPNFTKCVYTYTILKDGRISQVDIEEKYTINIGIKGNVTNKITHKYEYSEELIELTKEYMER